MNKTVTVSIRLTPQEHQKLVAIAEKRGYPWTITAVIKAAVVNLSE